MFSEAVAHGLSILAVAYASASERLIKATPCSKAVDVVPASDRHVARQRREPHGHTEHELSLGRFTLVANAVALAAFAGVVRRLVHSFRASEQEGFRTMLQG